MQLFAHKPKYWTNTNVDPMAVKSQGITDGKFVGFILWDPWISVKNVMTVHPIFKHLGRDKTGRPHIEGSNGQKPAVLLYINISFIYKTKTGE